WAKSFVRVFRRAAEGVPVAAAANSASSRRRFMSPNQDARITAAAATAMLLLAGTISSSGQPQAQRDFTKELANKLRGTYTVAALGGLLARGPAVQQISAELQQVIQSANTAVGHVEFYQADRSNAGLALPAKEFVQGLSAVGLD